MAHSRAPFPADRSGFPLPQGLRPGGRHDRWAPLRPRYVLCDVDGTLVDATGTVHEVVRRAAARALDAGIHVGYATGRGGQGLRVLQRSLRLPGPHVVANGGQVRLHGSAVRSWVLDRGVIDGVLDIDGVYAEFYTDQGYWVTDFRPAARPHWRLLGEDPAGTVHETRLDDVVKITVVLFGDAADARIRARLDRLPATNTSGTSPATPGLEFMNLTHPEANKGTALRAAAEVIGVDLAATVAVGDERNDVPMLAVAGTAVAMGQAPPAAVEVSHLVAPGVEEQGLATVLDATVSWSRQ